MKIGINRILYPVSLFALIVFSVASGFYLKSYAAPSSGAGPAKRYIVVFEENAVLLPALPAEKMTTAAAAQVIAQTAKKLALDFVQQYSLPQLASRQLFGYAINGFAASLNSNQLAKIEGDPRVAFVSEDRPLYLTAVQPTAQIIPTGIDRMDAENKTNKGQGVDVAVIDTGIDLTHPDLAGHIAGGVNCVGDGHADAQDGYGHGTHVAGIIGALDNSIGVVGVAPETRLWAVRALNDQGGGGLDSTVVCGIDYVTAHAPANGGPIRVANMSLGDIGDSDNNCGNTNKDALHKAICRSRDAGVTYVVAAGNNSGDASHQRPASYDDAVITVSALADSDGKRGGLGPQTTAGPDDTFATFSNYGSVVDLGAPGVDIYSTWKGGGYQNDSGTSMASPHVAGAAALYLATHPGASRQQVSDYLVANGEKPPH